MQRVQLPFYPANLPPTLEVRDFEDEGAYFRVVMEISPVITNDHFVMTAQCFQMNADGTFMQAPNGYPSRSNSTTHTVHRDDIGDVVEMDDAWCRHTATVTAEQLLTLPQSNGRPTEPGTHYGALCWDETAQAGAGQAWVWKEGFADSTARAKIEDMKKVLRTSAIHSGFAWNRVRNEVNQ